jgi:hypothetical protein
MDDAPDILKYPRTRHLEGSSLQKGDSDDRVPFSALRTEGATVVLEEKCDGANCGFRFDGGGRLWIQSRGHYLNATDRNAPRERDWTLLKDWLSMHQDEFLDRFEDRYIVYSEWEAIVHSVSYNRLPHFCLEFDIYDLHRGVFLDTPARRELCRGLPIVSVPVLYQGPFIDRGHALNLVGPSLFRTPESSVGDRNDWSMLDEGERWQEDLRRACALVGDDFPARLQKMDHSGLSEGLYVKLERDGEVVGRFKWVRPGFTQTILSSDEHWQSRFPVPNLLSHPTDCFPLHLARSQQPGPVSYDPDNPWEWGPWAPGASLHVPLSSPR